MATDKVWVIKNDEGYYSDLDGANEYDFHPVFSSNPDDAILYESLKEAKKDINEFEFLKNCSAERMVIEYTIKDDPEKMFEKLGYKKIIDTNPVLQYQNMNDNVIRFDNLDKYASISQPIRVVAERDTVCVSKDLIKAIDKQIEELGW